MTVIQYLKDHPKTAEVGAFLGTHRFNTPPGLSDLTEDEITVRHSKCLYLQAVLSLRYEAPGELFATLRFDYDEYDKDGRFLCQPARVRQLTLKTSSRTWQRSVERWMARTAMALEEFYAKVEERLSQEKHILSCRDSAMREMFEPMGYDYRGITQFFRPVWKGDATLRGFETTVYGGAMSQLIAQQTERFNTQSPSLCAAKIAGLMTYLRTNGWTP